MFNEEIVVNDEVTGALELLMRYLCIALKAHLSNITRLESHCMVALKRTVNQAINKSQLIPWKLGHIREVPRHFLPFPVSDE